MVFRGLVAKLKQGLAKTRQVFGGIRNLFRIGRRVDREFLEELEAKLYQADLGEDATTRLVERVHAAYENREVSEDLIEFLKAELKTLLTAQDIAIHWSPTPPTVVLVA